MYIFYLQKKSNNSYGSDSDDDDVITTKKPSSKAKSTSKPVSKPVVKPSPKASFFFFFYSFWRFVEYYDWEGKKSRLESAFRPFYFLLIDRHTKKRVGQISGRHRGRSRVKVIDPVPVCIHHIHRHAHTLEIIYDMKRKKYRHFIFLHQLQKKLLEWEDDKIERIQNFKVTFY